MSSHDHSSHTNCCGKTFPLIIYNEFPILFT